MIRTAVLVLFIPLASYAQTGGAAAPSATPSAASPSSLSSNRSRTTTPITDGVPRSIYLSGKVILADGRTPSERVTIERVCNSVVHREGYSDSRGEFGFNVGTQNTYAVPDASVAFEKVTPASEAGTGTQAGISNSDLANCEIRASLSGYVSDSITLGFRRPLDDPYIGVIYLHPISTADGSGGITTVVPREAAKAYEQGLESMKKQKWAEAEAHFTEAIRIAPKYLGAYGQLTILAVTREKWDDVARYTSQVLKLDPDVGADFYFYSAVANHIQKNLAVAEQHAREAARLDAQHRTPKINLLLGVILTEKGTYKEAADNLRLYLTLMPTAPDAAQVREQLAGLEKAAP